MKAFLLAVSATRARRVFSLATLLFGLALTASAYGQPTERERMNALHNTISASTPAPLEHSERSFLATGTELLSDGGFEGGYYGGSSTVDSSGVTGPWIWSNDPTWLTPIWQNYGTTYARTGSFMVYFNPLGPAQSQIAQKVSIPSGVTATLSFWLKFSGAAGGNPADVLGVNFCDLNGNPISGFAKNFRETASPGFSWVNYSYDVSSFAGQTVYLLFWTNLTGDTVYQLDDISLVANAASPPPSGTCTEDAFTQCLVGGRYKVTSHWKNQYSTTPVVANLAKTKLTDKTGAFWIADADTYEYLIRFNTATNNGKIWLNVTTFTSVEFWVEVTDTVNGRTKEYHNAPGDTTMIWDPNTFIYP
jgi:hypothetical protein